MQANQPPTVLRFLSSTVLGLGAFALLALPTQARGVANTSPSPEAQQSRGQQKPATRPQSGRGKARQKTGAQPASQQGRSNGARKQTRPAGQRAKNARDAANGKRAGQSRAKVTGPQSTRAQKARDQKARAQAQGNSQAQTNTRAENARKQALEAQAATEKRAANARRQAQAQAKMRGTGPTLTDAEQAARIKAARDQAAASGASGAQGDNALQGANASRAAKARRQRAARIGSAERQLTEAQKSTRIANARQKLAGLSTQDKATAKRYLADQEAHHRRMARMQRIETLLLEQGDTAGLARVKALRAKELAQHDLRRATLRKQLSEDEVQAIEDTGEVGNHPVRPDSQGAARTRSANQKSSSQGSDR